MGLKNNTTLLDALRQRCKVDHNDCWLWQGARNNTGYGVKRWQGKNRLVHRLTFSITKLDIIDQPDRILLHGPHCAKWCCNPDHVHLGSHAENLWERWQDSWAR